MSKKLSYILPCYNVERFVVDCLDSIYAQDLSEDEFEVICVNDCSTDKTRSIIAEYAKLHANLMLIDHADNSRGCGVPRNTGLRKAEGEYICFVDADDMLLQNVMKSFCNIAQKENLDVLLYNYVKLSEGRYKDEATMYLDSDVLSGGDYVEKCLHGNIGKLASAWAKLFKRAFLLQHSIWYTDLIMYEDSAFSWEAMICAKRVKSIHDIGYVFRKNDSSMTSGLKLKELPVFYAISVLYPNVLIMLIDRYGATAPEVIQKGIVNEIKTVIYDFFRKYLGYEEKDRREIYSMIRKNNTSIRKMIGYMNRKQKIAFSMLGFGYGAFNSAVKRLFA